MPAHVAILGRPNVGKSTLFNRLCGWRKALVHDQPGVTRDRIEATGNLAGREFLVIDTAGIELGGGGSLADRLLRQSLAGLHQADLGIFLIDGREGLTVLDETAADLLRRQSKPIILCVNKCEASSVKMAAISDAWSLGLGEPLPISAEHGEGLLDLAERMDPYLIAAEERLAGEADSDMAGRAVKFAIVGRPNAGKSTLINRLIGDDRLLTGPEPGLTRDAIALQFAHAGQRFELVDTAGLRRRAKVAGRLEQLSGSQTIRAIRMSHIVALMLDANQGLEKQDLTIANLALDEGRGLIILANKWDSVEDQASVRKALDDRLKKSLTQVRGVPLLAISAVTGRGIVKVMPAVMDVVKRWSVKLSTSRLNQWLKVMIEANPPPLVQNRRLKIRYVTQIAERPPTFAFFANKPPQAIPEHYKRYLVSGLRQTFDLAGTVIRTVFKHGANPYDPEATGR